MKTPSRRTVLAGLVIWALLAMGAGWELWLGIVPGPSLPKLTKPPPRPPLPGSGGVPNSEPDIQVSPSSSPSELSDAEDLSSERSEGSDGGEAGETKHPELAAARTACNAGDATGCRFLYERYEKEGGSSLPAAAGAALQGCSAGSAYLCVRYAEALAEGRGVPANREAALALLRQACEQGPELCGSLGNLLRAAGAQQDLVGALAAYRSACAAGVGADCVAAGDLLTIGDLAEDLSGASGWYKRGCELGMATSCERLAQLLLTPGSVVENQLGGMQARKRACSLGLRAACEAP